MVLIVILQGSVLVYITTYMNMYVTGCEEPGFLKHYSSKLVAIADFFKGNTCLVWRENFGGKFFKISALFLCPIINFTISFCLLKYPTSHAVYYQCI